MNKVRDDDYFMLSRDTLHELLRDHPGDSCLILQPTERPRELTIFDSFPNFNVAIAQRDVYPAVLFWGGRGDFVFVPIRDKHDLRLLFKIVYYDWQNPIPELKRFAKDRLCERKTSASKYIFHLSDLHFGAKNVEPYERRLKSLIKKQVGQLDKVDMNYSLDFVITGDILDSPNSDTMNAYRNFSEHLEDNYKKKPVCVLGNHDINNHGLAFWRNRQHLAEVIGGYPRIEILKEPEKIILLLFNSNTDGMLAQGKIGTEQMGEMGNLLDSVENLGDYQLIAVLHHHLLQIDRPDYFDERWFRKFMPRGLLEETLKLVDADLFLEWLTRRNVKCALHGHKHIPMAKERDGIKVISCGSSTGRITHRERGMTCISYNLIKIKDGIMTPNLYREERLGAGAEGMDILAPLPVEL